MDPTIASIVDRRFCDKAEKDDNVVDERWNPADAKNEAEVTVVCKIASYIFD